MALNTYQFGDELKKLGFEFYSGVPCSFLSNFINYAINECDYVMGANEGDVVAISSGATLAGKKSVVLMQNSGLTNAVSPLTSLNYCFRLPVLGFVSLRGEPGLSDEPQHELMGPITTNMLDIMEVKWEYLADNMEDAKEQLLRADNYIKNNQTFFFVVKKGRFDKVELKEQKLISNKNNIFKRTDLENSFPTRLKALETIVNNKTEDTILLATTGKTGRELYEIDDLSSNLYMVGSMGCISSIGLGISLNSNKKVIAIDGDGALLMRMGSLATNAYYSPDNMLHILLDNNVHDSTGGQATISHNVDFAQIAVSSGYKEVYDIASEYELKDIIENWNKNPKLTFIHLKTAKGSKKDLGRPKIKPYEVKERLIEFINGSINEK